MKYEEFLENVLTKAFPKKDGMILTQFRPDIQLRFLKNDSGLMFSSTLTNSFSLFSSSSHKLVSSDTKNDSFLQYAIPTALMFEHSLMPLNKPSFPIPLQNSDKHDTDGSSHTTGGGRRNFISLAFERACNSDETIRNEGLLALLSWARDQGKRPVCWLPFNFNYDAYYGVIGANHKDPEQKYDLNDASGWDIFDPGHLESAILFGGSALGLDECLHHFTMLLSWVLSTFPGKSIKSSKPLQGWHGSKQPRAAGLMIWFCTRAILLGYDTADQEFIDKFCCGHKPKEHLIAYLNDLITMDFPIGSDAPAENVMVNIGPVNGVNQLRGGLAFQEAILFASLGYLLRANIINDPLKTNVRNWLNARIAVILQATVDTRGMSYSFSRDTGFNQSHVDLANSLEQDKGHFYELKQIDGRIVDRPRIPDCELMVAGIALANGAMDQTAIMLNNLLPTPGSIDYPKMAKYLDIFYGLDTLPF